MAYVIGNPCTKDSDCVEVCPVDCIHPHRDDPEYKTAKQLYIDPARCIHCASCYQVCMAKAIMSQEKLPKKWARFEKENAAFFLSGTGSAAARG